MIDEKEFEDYKKKTDTLVSLHIWGTLLLSGVVMYFLFIKKQ